MRVLWPFSITLFLLQKTVWCTSSVLIYFKIISDFRGNFGRRFRMGGPNNPSSRLPPIYLSISTLHAPSHFSVSIWHFSPQPMIVEKAHAYQSMRNCRRYLPAKSRAARLSRRWARGSATRWRAVIKLLRVVGVKTFRFWARIRNLHQILRRLRPKPAL